MSHFRAGAAASGLPLPKAATPEGGRGDPPTRPRCPAPQCIPGVGSRASRRSGGPARAPSGGGGSGTLMPFPLGTGRGRLCSRSGAARGYQVSSAQPDKQRAHSEVTRAEDCGLGARDRGSARGRVPCGFHHPESRTLRGLFADVAAVVSSAGLASLRRLVGAGREEGGDGKGLPGVALEDGKSLWNVGKRLVRLCSLRPFPTFQFYVRFKATP